jgi:hypothetical protein
MPSFGRPHHGSCFICDLPGQLPGRSERGVAAGAGVGPKLLGCVSCPRSAHAACLAAGAHAASGDAPAEQPQSQPAAEAPSAGSSSGGTAAAVAAGGGGVGRCIALSSSSSSSSGGGGGGGGGGVGGGGGGGGLRRGGQSFVCLFCDRRVSRESCGAASSAAAVSVADAAPPQYVGASSLVPWTVWALETFISFC